MAGARAAQPCRTARRGILPMVTRRETAGEGVGGPQSGAAQKSTCQSLVHPARGRCSIRGSCESTTLAAGFDGGFCGSRLATNRARALPARTVQCQHHLGRPSARASLIANTSSSVGGGPPSKAASGERIRQRTAHAACSGLTGGLGDQGLALGCVELAELALEISPLVVAEGATSTRLPPVGCSSLCSDRSALLRSPGRSTPPPLSPRHWSYPFQPPQRPSFAARIARSSVVLLIPPAPSSEPLGGRRRECFGRGKKACTPTV